MQHATYLQCVNCAAGFRLGTTLEQVWQDAERLLKTHLDSQASGSAVEEPC
jgi:hypothetical protein